MKRRIVLAISAIASQFIAAAAFSQQCGQQAQALSSAQNAYNEAAGRYDSWNYSNNYYTTIIYNTWYIMHSSCGGNSIDCIEAALAARDQALFDLAVEGAALAEDKQDKWFLLADAQGSYDVCMGI